MKFFSVNFDFYVLKFVNECIYRLLLSVYINFSIEKLLCHLDGGNFAT